MSKDKLCPILSVGAMGVIGSLKSVPTNAAEIFRLTQAMSVCQEGKCALWTAEVGGCGLVKKPKHLTNITNLSREEGGGG